MKKFVKILLNRWRKTNAKWTRTRTRSSPEKTNVNANGSADHQEERERERVPFADERVQPWANIRNDYCGILWKFEIFISKGDAIIFIVSLIDNKMNFDWYQVCFIYKKIYPCLIYGGKRRVFV